MANALAVVNSVSVDSAGLGIALDVVYSGIDVPGGGNVASVYLYIQPTDQPAAIRSAMTSAVAVDATSRGFTVSSAAMTLPTFQKGA